MPDYFKESTPEEVFGPNPPKKNLSSDTNQQDQPSSAVKPHQKITRRLFLATALGGLVAAGGAYHLSGFKTPSLPDFSSPAAKKESPTPLPQYELYSGERLVEQQKWEDTLGLKIHIDPYPSFLSPDIIEKLKSYGLHLRYIPQISYTSNGLLIKEPYAYDESPVSSPSPTPLPKWREINQSNLPVPKRTQFQHLEPKFWQEVNQRLIPSPTLPGEWAAVEIMPKPDINQSYPESFFTFDKGYKRRVHISWAEVKHFLDWTKKNTLKNIGLVNVSHTQLRMLEAVEWNFLANREQWPNNNSAEWTNTSYAGKDKLLVGAGGNSRYEINSPATRNPFWGYRVGLFFSKSSKVTSQPIEHPNVAPPFQVVQGFKKPNIGEVTSIKYGESLFDEDDVEKTFGFKIPPDQIPKIPFSRQELQDAERRGEYLIFRTDQNDKGESLTMDRMSSLRQPDIIKQFGGSKGFTSQYTDELSEGLSRNQTPRRGWRLVSSIGLPGSEKQNYFEQTQSLVDLVPKLYAHSGIPEHIKEALDEWERSKEAIAKLVNENSDKGSAAEQIAGLKLNQFLRRSPSEYVYDLFMFASRMALTRFEEGSSWTNQAISGNRILTISYDHYHKAFFQSAKPAHQGRNSLIISRY